MLKRLEVEYDAFFLRATHYLYCSQKMGAWQFLAVVPYHVVSIKTLWRIFYLLHENDTEAEVREIIYVILLYVGNLFFCCWKGDTGSNGWYRLQGEYMG